MINKNLIYVLLITSLVGCSSVSTPDSEKQMTNETNVIESSQIDDQSFSKESSKTMEESDKSDYMELLSSELLRGTDIFSLTRDSVLVQVLVSAMDESVLNGNVVPIEKEPVNDSFMLYCKNISIYSKGIMEKHQSGENIVENYNKMADSYRRGMKQIIDSDLPEKTKIDRMELETSRIKIMHFLTKIASYTPRYKEEQDKADASVFFENVIYKSCLQENN